jgi:membrane-associated protein
MTSLSGVLAAVPPWLLLLLVFLVPALEASTLLGVVVPGETAVLLGGVFAHQGRLPLAVVMTAAVLGAVVGDNVGYVLGARLGPRLLTRVTGRAGKRLQRARSFVQRFGAPAVFLGRWVAVLRALVPSVAGAGGLRYRSFAVYNLAGGAVWGVAVAGLGYLAATAYGTASRDLGLAGAAVVLLLAVVAVAGAVWTRGRRRANRSQHFRAAGPPADGPEPEE